MLYPIIVTPESVGVVCRIPLRLARNPYLMISDTLAHPFRGTRCLVTGGAGFIGCNLTRLLLNAGAHVTVLDNFAVGKRDHLPVPSDALTIIEGDLCSLETLPDLVNTADYVFHLAAQVGNIKSLEQTEQDAKTNVLGSVRLFRACRNTSVKKVVYSSSSAIFGEAQRIPIDEEHPGAPASFYALSKLTGENYALLAASLWGVPIISLRYFNVFGLPMEYNEYTGVISIFFNRLGAGEPLIIYGDGHQFRDFVYVADVVQANMRAAVTGRPGTVYNIGSGQASTIRQLAETMIEITGRKSKIMFENVRAGEVRESLADIRRAKAELSYAPVYDLRRGLAEMWEQISHTGRAEDTFSTHVWAQTQ